MPIDRVKYPRCADYIDSLPRGLDSHPECAITGESMQVYLKMFPQLSELDGLPPQLQRLIHPPVPDGWIPEAHFLALAHAVRDAFFKTDQDYHHHVDLLNRELFNRPIYRALFRLLSPQLLVMGAAKRWNSIHRGTGLDVDATPVDTNGRRSVSGYFTYPSRLMDQLAIERYSRGWFVAVHMARAANPKLVVDSVKDTQAHYTMSWDL